MATNRATRGGVEPTAFGPDDDSVRHGVSHHTHQHHAAATPLAPAGSEPPTHASSHRARPAPADLLSSSTRVMDAVRARHARGHGGDR